MKVCRNCGQSVAEKIAKCPNCGSEVREGREYIDEYRIKEVLHEGYSSILCKAVKEGEEGPVMIRIFTPDSGIDEKIAERLGRELEELKKLPEEYFVRHHEIRRSSDGLWYRVSEWVDAKNWGALLSSGLFQDYRSAFGLFSRIASILEGLHRIGHIIPHLILDDIMVVEGEEGTLEVKIDFKLSRFLDPQMNRPGPMLKKLLTCHPDIINRRPLDARSDIWSLGKVFVELLSGDPEVVDFSAKVDELPLPHEIQTLIKVMLAEDPDLRPRSMAEVAEAFSRVQDNDIRAARLEHIESAPARVGAVKGLRKRISILAIILAVITIGGLSWYHFVFEKKGSEAVFMDFVGRYANSVGFVLVDYSIKSGEDIMYQNRTEGTAFLVDKEGYLLTNRHVVCPWLEDTSLFYIVNSLKQDGKSPYLAYRIFLWFEGERAFNRFSGLSESSDLEDVYHLESAFSTERAQRLSIAGVAKSPTKTWQVVKSPLKDDFAVLKIDGLPEALKPLPLDLTPDVRKIPKLAPVITLGFPLGSRTQEATVNVSVTQGHVRRTFENMFQVDTSIHRGNSGGPVIDTFGKVVGIASAIAVDWATAPVPVITPLSDIGMVLPIAKAVSFIQELKAGDLKWNGVLDLTVDDKLKRIRESARQSRWAEARALADKELKLSFDPTLIMAAGVLHFCAGDKPGAKQLLDKALSMDKENNTARLLLYLLEWLTGRSRDSAHRREMLKLDWRSPDEFFGYLVRVLEGQGDEKTALKGGYTEVEKSWLCYIAGLIRAKQRDLSGSEELFKEAVLTANIDDWVYFLALAELERVQNEGLSSLRNKDERTGYQLELKSISQRILEDYAKKSERQIRLAPLIAEVEQKTLDFNKKRELLKQLLDGDYRRGEVLVRLVYYYAMDDLWDQALEYAGAYLAIEGRESADRLSVGLLVPEIYHRTGHRDKAAAALEDFRRLTVDPWYRAISESFLAGGTEQSLMERAGESPENLLIAHTALGFWAEGSGDKKTALKHYREALGSYLDERIEYEFAVARIERLRKKT
jgi:S1-C subfamily serine protease